MAKSSPESLAQLGPPLPVVQYCVGQQALLSVCVIVSPLTKPPPLGRLSSHMFLARSCWGLHERDSLRFPHPADVSDSDDF